jgi:hypothetical protein
MSAHWTSRFPCGGSRRALLPDLPPAPGLAQLVSGLMAALETFDTPLDMTEVSRTFGVTPTTIDELLASFADFQSREAASVRDASASRGR